jgi:cytoskeletal protein CcmA (bactofilin family)
MFSKKRARDPAISTLVGADTKLVGDLEFTGGCLIDGHVKGNVRALNDEHATLRVSERGYIEGTVDVPIMLLNGTINGDVKALERVELGAKSKVVGNLNYTLIEVAIGAEVHGNLIHAALGVQDIGPRKEEATPSELSADGPAVARVKAMGES